MKKKTHATPPSLRLSRQSLPGFGGAGGDQGFEPRLRAYSSLSTAALATAAALSAAATASAQIHNITTLTNAGGTFGTIITLATNTHGSHAVNFGIAIGNRTAKFYFKGKNHSWPGPLSLAGGPILNSFTNGDKVDVGGAVKVAPGGAIQGGQFGFGGRRFFYYNALATPNNKGNFIPAANGQVTGYFGFKAVTVNSHFTHSNHYYGWLRIRVTADGSDRPLSLALDPINGIYGAYALKDSIPGGITAGATAIPEPASVAMGLALFALGAAGVREHRRRRQQAA